MNTKLKQTIPPLFSPTPNAATRKPKKVTLQQPPLDTRQPFSPYCNKTPKPPLSKPHVSPHGNKTALTTKKPFSTKAHKRLAKSGAGPLKKVAEPAPPVEEVLTSSQEAPARTQDMETLCKRMWDLFASIEKGVQKHFPVPGNNTEQSLDGLSFWQIVDSLEKDFEQLSSKAGNPKTT